MVDWTLKTNYLPTYLSADKVNPFEHFPRKLTYIYIPDSCNDCPNHNGIIIFSPPLRRSISCLKTKKKQKNLSQVLVISLSRCSKSI